MSTPPELPDVPATYFETIVFGEAATEGELFASPASPIRFDLQLQTAKATGIRYTNVPRTVRNYGLGTYGWGMTDLQRLYELALNYLALLMPVTIWGETPHQCANGLVSQLAWDKHIAFATAFLTTDKPVLTVPFVVVVRWLEGQGIPATVVEKLDHAIDYDGFTLAPLPRAATVLLPKASYEP